MLILQPSNTNSDMHEGTFGGGHPQPHLPPSVAPGLRQSAGHSPASCPTILVQAMAQGRLILLAVPVHPVLMFWPPAGVYLVR